MKCVIISVDELDELIAILNSEEPIAHESRMRWRKRLEDIRELGQFDWIPDSLN